MMNSLDALKQIQNLNVPVLTTNDVTTLLSISTSHASHIMQQLLDKEIVFRIKQGLWGLTGKVDRLALPSYICAPYLAYVSLQTALHIHGLIEQIPEVVYAVSTGRTRQYKTSIATISIHHIHPDFFFGFEVITDPMLKIARPEKALVDFLYLQPAKSHFFKALPEIDLSQIDFAKAEEYVQKIPYAKRRTMVKRRLESIFPSG